eukprot:m.346481 g.346481  ORF g.346481 m.346481 type:complete len:67 (-) comp29378_c0_seq1:688-888(-)
MSMYVVHEYYENAASVSMVCPDIGTSFGMGCHTCNNNTINTIRTEYMCPERMPPYIWVQQERHLSM